MRELELISDEMADLAEPFACRGTRRKDGFTWRDEFAEDHAVNVRSIADPSFMMSQTEQVVGVDEAQHPRRMHHDGACHVLRVAHRVRALCARQRQLDVRRHTALHEVPLGVELKQPIEEEHLGPVGKIGEERLVKGARSDRRHLVARISVPFGVQAVPQSRLPLHPEL